MDVGAWLKDLGLERYADAFAANGVDGAILPELTAEDFRELGVVRLADRKRLLKAIADLPEGEGRAERHPLARPARADERRQVTVLFADISQFTRIASELDAEETHELLNRYFEIVDGIVENYGGAIDKHIGDNVMALFGAPVAHTNDPERAVRAACDIHAAMEALSTERGQALRVHIGIASGEVVAAGTGSGSHREYTVTGDIVNLASRLQDLARPGESLISGAVHRAVSRIASCSSRGAVTVKGLGAPVEVWMLEGLAVDPKPEYLGAFVGRRAELARFISLLEDCQEQGKGHSILIRGEPGIGKSRLAGEFAAIAAARGFELHKALVLDFGVAKGHDAIGALVRSLLAIPTGGDEDLRWAAADRAISSLGMVSESNRTFLLDLLDLPQPTGLRGLFAAMDTAARNKGWQETVSELVASKAASAPLLVVIEDIHWADRPTLEHLAGIASAVAKCRALLVATTRVEGRTLEQGWFESLRGCPLTGMELQPLRKIEAEELARDLMDSETAKLAAYVERAEGNPLFLVELTRDPSRTADAELPGTLRGLVLARMDGLPEEDRSALQAAAVIGQRFALEAVRRLVENQEYDCATLVKHRLVRPEGPDYLFAHALIREGVYSSLLRARRRKLHTRAAEWFAGHDSGLCAEHLDRADDAHAPQAYLAAAREESQDFHYERALRLVSRALEIAPDRNSFALRCLEGELLRNLGSVRASIDSYRRALGAATEEIDRCRAWIGVAEGLRLSEEHNELLGVLGQAEVVAKNHDLSPELARICQLKGNVHFVRGEIDVYLQANATSLEHARDGKSPELEAQALGGLGDAEFSRGRMISAQGHYHQCIELGREHGFGRVVAANLPMRGQTLLYMNEIEAALNDCRAALELARKIRQPRAEMIAAIVGSYVADMGEPAAGKDWVEVALNIARRLGARLFQSSALECLARVKAQEGARTEADMLAQEAIAILRNSENGMRFQGARALGALAVAADDPDRRGSALAEGEIVLRAGATGHNYLWFYRDAIEVCLRAADWDEVERYAEALADYTRAEPLPWSSFFIGRGLALSAFGRGQRDDATLEKIGRLRNDAARVGFKNALPALEEALLAH